MSARVLLVSVVMSVCTSALAGDNFQQTSFESPTTGSSQSTNEAAAQDSAGSWIHDAMDPEVREKLQVALGIAVERVRDVEACGDLFTELGADAMETLNASRYLQVHTHMHEVQICERDGAVKHRGATNLAFTKVGGAWTWLCRDFARISDKEAAIAVIHEALHKAGLPEWPSVRTAKTSPQITRMVKKKCEF